MSRYNVHQSNFKNGMISQKLLGRTDIAELDSSAKKVKNFLPAPMGGLFSRPGTVNQIIITDKGCLIPWERPNGIYYITYTQKALASGDCPFSAFTGTWQTKSCAFNTEQLLDNGLYTPTYPTHAQLIDKQTDSSNNMEALDYHGFSFVVVDTYLVLTHNSGLLPPLVFWVNPTGGGVKIDHWQFTGRLSISSEIGSYYNSIEIWAGYKTTPYEINKDNNVWLRPNFAIPGGQEGKQATGDINTLSAFAGNTATPLNYFTADMVNTFFVVNQNNVEGVYFINALTSASVAQVTAVFYGYDATVKSTKFRRQLWAPDLGFPKIVSSYNNRIIFANTDTKPNWFFASRTNDRKEFIAFHLFQSLTTYPLTEADSFEFPLTSKDYADIKWISQQGDLLIGTGKEEFVVKQGEGASSIQNIGISPESSIGGSPVVAIKNSESAFFVSADGKSIRQVQYNFQVNGFRSKNISILNDDIIYTTRSNQTVDSLAGIKIIKIAWQESNRTLWALTNSDNLFSVTIEPNSETVAWAYHVIGNEESVVDIFTFFSQGLSRSVLGMVVNRNSKYAIDFLAPEYLSDSLSIDSLNIGDQPIFMDGCCLMSTLISPIVSFNSTLALTTASFPDSTSEGIVQRLPTGKKLKITAVDVIDAGIVEVNLFLYVINHYEGYGYPNIQFATSLANALSGTAYSSGVGRRITVEDAEPSAKYTKWGVFENYKSKTVDVIADGILYEDIVIDASGFLTLPIAVSKISMGYRFEGEIETVTPDTKGNLGSTIGSIKRVDRAYIRYYKSRTAKIGSSESNLEPVVFPTVPFTGAIDHFIDTSSDREWSLKIKKTQSLPLNVMSVTLRGQTNE